MATILISPDVNVTIERDITVGKEQAYKLGLVHKYNLKEVNISFDQRIEVNRAHQFMAYFKKRLNQALVHQGRLNEETFMPHAVGGGFLSDAYMKEQRHLTKDGVPVDRFSSRDMDIFMQIPIESIKAFNMEQFLEEITQELDESYRKAYPQNWNSTHFSIKSYERHHVYDFISVPYIIEGNVWGIGKVEIILCQDLERIFDFDISIRHFFSFDDQVLAPAFAIDDVKNKKLSVVCPITPKSTLVRLFYFKHRYGFDIEYNSLDILAWVMSKKDVFTQDILDYLNDVDKFKYDYELRSYLFSHVIGFLESYTIPAQDQKSRHELSAHELKSALRHVEFGTFADKGKSLSYIGEFKDNSFPYPDLFFPIYNYVVGSHLYDVLFAIKFPHGFFGKYFNEYARGSFNQIQFLTTHGYDYIELLKKCDGYQWPNLWTQREDVEFESYEEHMEYKAQQFEEKLFELFKHESQGMINKYLSRQFKKKLRSGDLAFLKKPLYQLLPENISEEDIPPLFRGAPSPVRQPMAGTPADPFAGPSMVDDGEDLPF